MKTIPEYSTGCKVLKKIFFSVFYVSINMCFTRMLVEIYFFLCVAVKKFGKMLWSDRGVLVIILYGYSFLVFERLEDRHLRRLGRRTGLKELRFG